jgi:hypothetical protein
MGKYVVGDNVIGSAPRLVKHGTLIVKIERDPKESSDKAEIVEPNEVVNNRVGGKLIASGDMGELSAK